MVTNGLIAKYGSYAHDAAEVLTGTRLAPSFSGHGIEVMTRNSVQVNGRLIADTRGDLLKKLTALQNAYAEHGKDFGVFLSDGRTPAGIFVQAKRTVGGTRVTTKPSLVGRDGIEFVNVVSYQLALEWDEPNTLAQYIEYEETLTLGGGGSKWVLIPVSSGPAIRQQTVEQMPYFARQTGVATGAFASLPAAAPKWPQFVHPERSTVSPVSPMVVGNGANATQTNYRVSWSYEFESTTPLVGLPSERPSN